MSVRKSLVLGLVLILSVALSSVLIWHGLNLDQEAAQPQVLGNKTEENLPSFKSPPDSTVSSNIQINTFLVTKVVDGDTIEIKTDGEMAKVRLIGIDTPETVDPHRPAGCYGRKASDETKRLLTGKEVVLTKDVSETDKYKRLLRYVYLPMGDGKNLFVNDYLIRQGFAKILTYPPDVKYNRRFLEAEKEARDNLRGLWSECK